MCDPISMGLAGAAAIAGPIHSAEQQRKAGAQARKQAERQAAAQAQAAEEQANRQAAKAPSIEAIVAANQRAAMGGPASTMVTGGVDPSKLLLGRATLLGG